MITCARIFGLLNSFWQKRYPDNQLVPFQKSKSAPPDQMCLNQMAEKSPVLLSPDQQVS